MGTLCRTGAAVSAAERRQLRRGTFLRLRRREQYDRHSSESEACPFAYAAVLADANVDGFNGAQDYASVVARAVDEAEDGHAFVTEFADSTVGLSGASLWSRMSLRRSALESATSRAEPRALTRAAQALFRDHPFVTRFRTALDPEEMTRDPVFAFLTERSSMVAGPRGSSASRMAAKSTSRTASTGRRSGPPRGTLASLRSQSCGWRGLRWSSSTTETACGAAAGAVAPSDGGGEALCSWPSSSPSCSSADGPCAAPRPRTRAEYRPGCSGRDRGPWS